MSKKTSRNDDFLNSYKKIASPNVYKLLLELVNEGKQDLAEQVTKADYLIEYFNTCVKKRDYTEAKETLERINARLAKLKSQGVDVSYLEYFCDHIIKSNKAKL